MRCWLEAVHQSGFISMNLFIPICLPPLSLPSPNPNLPSFFPSFCPFISSSSLPFLLLLIHSFFSVLTSFSLASSSLHCTQPPLYPNHSTSPHPSVTQLIVLSFRGALACFSKVIFPEFERFHFKKLSIRSSNEKSSI